jgi:phosphoglycerol geranylgeranyltransferase
MKILEILRQRRQQGKKSIAVLIDPDKAEDPARLKHLIHLASENCVDFIFVGGSLVTTSNLSEIIQSIKEDVNIPVVLFPGSYVQIDPSADAVLFLSLISGRNPDLLIGQHVQAAPILRNYHMEVLPTGYILISSGRTTSVAYISNTTPIPEDKYSLAACTAMAGEMLGLQLIYLDAGSGAEREISPRMISTVRKAVSTPLIVGGGINTASKALQALEAGADLIVIGNALEKNPETLNEISDKVYDWNQSIETRK